MPTLITLENFFVTFIRTNAINHWVPSTIKTMKGSGNALMSKLGNSRSDHAWVVKCLILKQERLLSTESLTEEQVTNKLLHQSNIFVFHFYIHEAFLRFKTQFLGQFRADMIL